MTREEAIEILSRPKSMRGAPAEILTAHAMAIKALEQESCDDTVSREDAKSFLYERLNRLNNDELYDIFSVIIDDMYNELPPVQPKSRWIPVSEKLPEKGGDYLVTIEWKGSYSGDVYIETNMAVYREKEKEWDCAGVIAWQPLPEPYEPTN